MNSLSFLTSLSYKFHLNAGRLIKSFIWVSSLYLEVAVLLIVDPGQICRYVCSGSWTDKFCIFHLRESRPCKIKRANFLLDVVACVLAYADWLSSSPNHHAEIPSFYVIIDQSSYRDFYHTSRYYLRAFCTIPDTICVPTLGKSRFCLVISTIYSYCKYFFYLCTGYNDASWGFGIWAKTLRGQLF